MKKWVLLVAATVFLVHMAGCGVSDKALDNADQRIKALKAKGIPDSLISQPLVYLYGAREANKKSEWGTAAKDGRLLKKELARAESFYQNRIANLKPTVDSLMQIVKNLRQKYSGIPLKRYDSLIAISDSFARINWLLQAYNKGQEILKKTPLFDSAVAKAKELSVLIPGEWVCSQQDTNYENKDVNAVTKKVFTFEKNGKAKFVESKKGQSGPYLREDWEFVSTGTWDMNADTVFVFVNKFAATRQMFERIFILEGGKKKEWRKEPKPTYDSTITDGSQDRWVSYADLKEDFKQTKKFK